MSRLNLLAAELLAYITLPLLLVGPLPRNAPRDAPDPFTESGRILVAGHPVSVRNSSSAGQLVSRSARRRFESVLNQHGCLDSADLRSAPARECRPRQLRARGLLGLGRAMLNQRNSLVAGLLRERAGSDPSCWPRLPKPATSNRTIPAAYSVSTGASIRHRPSACTRRKRDRRAARRLRTTTLSQDSTIDHRTLCITSMPRAAWTLRRPTRIIIETREIRLEAAIHCPLFTQGATPCPKPFSSAPFALPLAAPPKALSPPRALTISPQPH